MQTSVTFSADLEHVNDEVQRNGAHHVRVSVDAPRNYAVFECSSREALYELGRTLMHGALFGSGEIELFPLIVDGKPLVVEGVRLVEDSARVSVHFPSGGGHAA